MSLKIDVSTSFTGLLQVDKKLKIINMADRCNCPVFDIEHLEVVTTLVIFNNFLLTLHLQYGYYFKLINEK